VAAGVLVATLGLAGGADAAKWRHCPEPLPLAYTSARGAVTTTFVHPGHEMGIILSTSEVAATGGFSTAPEGNVLAIEFASIFGPHIAVPPVAVASVSASTLYFAFPDTQAVLGRIAAGPVEINVTTGGKLTAHIMPQHLVALPPATDVAKIMAGHEQEVLATLDARGSLWVPIEFYGFGETDMEMPGCESLFTPLGAFVVGVSVRASSATSLPPLRGVRRADLYLGDFLIDGGNAYGQRLPNTIKFNRMPRGFGVCVCGANDAVDLVMRVRGRRRWAQRGSGFADWVWASTPLRITLSDAAGDPDVHDDLADVRFDSFGNPCGF
jgi:hypothetical protein